MQNNKTIVLFLAKFFGAYAVLFLTYSFYLDNAQVKTDVFACSSLTKNVAFQTKRVINLLGYRAEVIQHENEVSMKLKVNDKFVARIIEGCNSVSIIILFASFVFAFSSTFKITGLYIVFGSLLIYIVNIFRIAIISIAMFKYPKYQNLLHDYVFPAIIYGLTFLMWFIWVQKFSKIKK